MYELAERLMLDSVIRLASLAVMSVVVANLRERSETCVRYGPANAIRRAQRGEGHQKPLRHGEWRRLVLCVVGARELRRRLVFNE